jgi:hypothetical protein
VIFWKTPGDVVERGDAHAVHADVLRDVRFRPVHDAGVKQDDHAVLLGARVDGGVGGIVIVLERAGDFTEAAKAGSVEPIDLMQHVRSIKLDLAETDQPIGMLLDGILHAVEIFGIGHQEGEAIGLVEPHQEPLEKGGVAVVVQVSVDELGLGEGQGEAGEQQQQNAAR